MALSNPGMDRNEPLRMGHGEQKRPEITKLNSHHSAPVATEDDLVPAETNVIFVHAADLGGKAGEQALSQGSEPACQYRPLVAGGGFGLGAEQ
nr:hypothetical protein CFP56_02856 [Quercus suber]